MASHFPSTHAPTHIIMYVGVHVDKYLLCLVTRCAARLTLLSQKNYRPAIQGRASRDCPRERMRHLKHQITQKSRHAAAVRTTTRCRNPFLFSFFPYDLAHFPLRCARTMHKLMRLCPSPAQFRDAVPQPCATRVPCAFSELFACARSLQRRPHKVPCWPPVYPNQRRSLKTISRLDD